MKTKKFSKKQIKTIVEENINKRRAKPIKITYKDIKTTIKALIPYILSGGKNQGILITLPGPRNNETKQFIEIEDQKFYQLIQKRQKKKVKELNCFVGHNFDQKKINRLRPVLNQIFDYIKVKPYYADKILTIKTILEKVLTEINKTDFVIFEITKLKPNVAIEVGGALIIKRVTTFLIKKGEKEPTELQGLDMIKYKDYLDLAYQLLNKLPGLLEEQKLI